MNETVLYKELGILTKDKDRWEENIPYVSSFPEHLLFEFKSGVNITIEK